jgi:DNA-binding LacI/PurR family transcriptional regulator
MTQLSPTEIDHGRAAAQLRLDLRARICSGEIPAGELLPSIRELGRQQGLAPNTVRRALQAMATEGLLVAEPRRGYRVLPGASDVESGGPLACVLSGGSHVGNWDRLIGAMVSTSREAARASQRPFLVLGAAEMNPAEIAAQLRRAGAWGAFLNTDDSQLIEQIAAVGIPAVVVDAFPVEESIDTVVQDGFLGGLFAAEHLAREGHRRIAWLGPEIRDGELQIVERFSGAMGGLARAGLSVSGELMEQVAFNDYSAARDAARRLLSMPERPTAILSLWQFLSEALIQVAAELGLVPGVDFEMVGWITSEGYEANYASRFGGGPVPAAITWSMKTLVRTAFRRIEERRNQSDLEPLLTKVAPQLVAKRSAK